MNRLCKLIATVFYLGYLPVAPGSIGSFAALFLYGALKNSPQMMGASIVLCIILGLLTAGKTEKLLGGKDASEIIIDEFAGMLVALYLLPPTMGYIVAAFILFRFFDIIKPRPIRNLEKLNGSLGIMLDDLLAGVYANLILQIVHRLF
ncbi:MAG: phosphatidylglycerophosphatase A [Candidatus Gorgyraea atricola]|nr:phosphatidylglycerophosphatase A [Candidatus Gorgyraea atricola]